VTRALQRRARWTRTNSSLLVNSPDGWVADQGGPAPWGAVPSGSGEPPVYWLGLDSGGGRYPIGPNGPFGGYGEALAAVTRATSLIVDPLTQVPWRIVDRGTENLSDASGVQRPRPRWITDPMLTRPDDRIGPSVYPATVRLPSAAFWSTLLRSALWWGTGCLIFVEDQTGAPTAGSMRVLAPYLVEPVRDDSGVLVWRIGDDSEGVLTDRDGRVTLGGVPWRLLVLRNPHTDVDQDGRSKGVFEQHPMTFGLATSMESYAQGTFASGVPAGYLRVETPGLRQDQADDLKARWMAAHGGDRRSIAVLNAVTSFVPLSLSPVDSALVEMKTASLVDIAHAFGMESWMLDGPAGNSTTYSNSEQRYSMYRIGTLGRWTVDLQEWLSQLLPAETFVFIDLDGLLRADTATRFDSYEKALRGGFYTVDEIRALEGLPPLGDAGV
jgi:HK97 family phage portal protein